MNLLHALMTQQTSKKSNSFQDNSIKKTKMIIEDSFFTSKHSFLFQLWIFGNPTLILGKQDSALSVHEVSTTD